LGVYPTFRTPILRLMPNVISKFKQNSSDMNEMQVMYKIVLVTFLSKHTLYTIYMIYMI
jgi:hypothetical protein